MAPPERPRAPRPARGRPAAPRSGAGGAKPPFKRREDDARKPYKRRDDAERKPYQARADGPKKPYQARADGPKKPYQRREDGPKKPYQRRDDGPKKPYQRREDGPKRPYAARTDAPRKPYERREERPRVEERQTPKKWGGVTRRGARQVTNPTPLTDEAKAYEKREFARSARPEVDRWERAERPARPAPRKPTRKGPPPRTKSLPRDVVDEVAAASGNPRRAPMLQKRLADASRHIQQGRDKDAVNLLRQLAQEVPEAASVRELYGQALYSLGRYRQAATELEAFIELSHSADQHPMLADSYRALGRHKKVQELWAELREASPSPDIVSEGRIVTAGSLADQGKLEDAIRLLEAAPPVRGRVSDRHMRTWYALADLYERSGELSKSRALFSRVVQHEADFADAADRLHALG